MTARMKHDFAVKAEQDRKEKQRQERSKQSFFMTGQAAALAGKNETSARCAMILIDFDSSRKDLKKWLYLSVVDLDGDDLV